MVLTVSILCIFFVFIFQALSSFVFSTFLICHKSIWQDIILGALGYMSHNPYHPHEVQGIIYYGRLHIMQWFWLGGPVNHCLLSSSSSYLNCGQGTTNTATSYYQPLFLWYIHTIYACTMYLDNCKYVNP